MLKKIRIFTTNQQEPRTFGTTRTMTIFKSTSSWCLRGLWLINIFIFCCLFAVPCFAENEFSLGLAPVFDIALGNKNLKPGMGAQVSFDWAFWPFAKGFNLGLTAGGSFASIPVKVPGVAANPINIFEGKLGPFVSWRYSDRWSFFGGLNGGVYRASRQSSSGVDTDNVTNVSGLFSAGLGAEFRLLPYIALFAEGGFSYLAPKKQADKPRSIPSVNAALGVRFNLSEIMGGQTRVKVEKTEQYRVFPVSWAWYEHNPIAKVKVSNEEPNAITDINLYFYLDSFMSQPWAFATLPRVNAGESLETPVTALFNEVLINLIENINAAGVIQIQYRSLGAKKESVSVVQMPIFHRNAFSWEDDRRAAAFVSPRDSSVRIFSRYVASAVEAHGPVGNTPKNVCFAAALFEALRLYGISYVVVPATSYKNLSANEAALDNVSYPYQALYYRGGDCTYLSILYCSLLEALNVETAFITVPGHLYLAYEVGDAKWRAGSRDILEIGGKRWMPIEITIPDEGFMRAWSVGASEWRKYGKNAALYPIRDAWELYPPVTVPASGDHPPEMPEAADIVNAMERQLSIQ